MTIGIWWVPVSHPNMIRSDAYGQHYFDEPRDLVRFLVRWSYHIERIDHVR